MSLLRIKNLQVEFSTSLGKVQAVDGVSLRLYKGETIALVGETGCGKSVVAHSILQLLPQNAGVAGEILFNKRNLLRMNEKELAHIRGQEISLVIQNPALALNPAYTIGYQMIEPLLVHRKMNKKQALILVKTLLKKLKFKGPDRAVNAYPHQMSGGMKQRILIGISVVLSPQIVIADEPTKGLDTRLRNMVLEELKLVKEMNQSSMILITHDLHAAKDISDRTAIMYAGEIVEIGSTTEFFREPLHPYSKGLLESLPERGFSPIPGTSPSMISPPKGCKFFPRCSLKREVCSQKKPGFYGVKKREVKCVLFS
jgi:peptide/nickel transport system ATP-binding protein